jgi:hypothetical protein
MNKIFICKTQVTLGQKSLFLNGLKLNNELPEQMKMSGNCEKGEVLTRNKELLQVRLNWSDVDYEMSF